jgi:CHRD domain
LRTRTPLLVMLAVLAIVATSAGAVLAAKTTLTATLMGGAAETPAGDPNGSGTASITIDPATRQVCWNITVTNIAPAVASHIHAGAAGVNGPVVVPLDTNGFTGTTTGCVAAPATADLQAILANPAGFYVNVHTADFPAGALRGQLSVVMSNTALPHPLGSPLLPLYVVLLLIGLAGALREVQTRV